MNVRGEDRAPDDRPRRPALARRRQARAPTAGAVALALGVAGGISTSGYVLEDDRWPDGSITMHLQLAAPPALLADGSATYGESAESALAAWNQYTLRVQFLVVRDSAAPKGDGNSVNNVSFANDVYGMALGRDTLAVTTLWRRRGTRTESDVIFNSAAGVWDAYAGPLRRGALDFHRIALHEFGHVLGLNHPDESGQAVSAIMNSHPDNLDRLTDDDIAGVRALYEPAARGNGGGAEATTLVPAHRDGDSLDFRRALAIERTRR